MQITLTVDEAVRLARATGGLPPVVRAVRGQGDTVTAELDGRLLPGLGRAARFAAAAVGVVPVHARFTGFADGVARFDLAASVRGLPVGALVGAVAHVLDDQLAARGLPPGSVELRRDPAGPVLLVQPQPFLAPLAGGLTVTDLAVTDATLQVVLSVRDAA